MEFENWEERWDIKLMFKLRTLNHVWILHTGLQKAWTLTMDLYSNTLLLYIYKLSLCHSSNGITLHFKVVAVKPFAILL
jgi:hypothetical protein